MFYRSNSFSKDVIVLAQMVSSRNACNRRRVIASSSKLKGFLKLRRRTRIPVVSKETGNTLSLNKQKYNIVNQIKCFVVQSRIFRNLRKSSLNNMITNKQTILTQGYKLLLNGFQHFGISRCYRGPHS